MTTMLFTVVMDTTQLKNVSVRFCMANNINCHWRSGIWCSEHFKIFQGQKRKGLGNVFNPIINQYTTNVKNNIKVCSCRLQNETHSNRSSFVFLIWQKHWELCNWSKGNRKSWKILTRIRTTTTWTIAGIECFTRIKYRKLAKMFDFVIVTDSVACSLWNQNVHQLNSVMNKSRAISLILCLEWIPEFARGRQRYANTFDPVLRYAYNTFIV